MIDFYLHDHILANVPSAKNMYLGVTLTQDFKWDTHIQNICVKANQTIGFLRRNLNISTVSIRQQAKFSLVRPLEAFQSCAGHLHSEKHGPTQGG